jgi:hypothetical protein
MRPDFSFLAAQHVLDYPNLPHNFGKLSLLNYCLPTPQYMMVSSGEQAAATLSVFNIVPASGDTPASTLTVPVIFYHDPNDLKILSYTASSQAFATITEGPWLQPAGWTDPQLKLSWFRLAGGSVAWGRDGSAPVAGIVTAAPVAIPTPSITTTNSSTTVSITASNQTPSPTSETASPQTSAAAKNSKGGSGPGVVAGAAIGCLIAGALIAGLIFWFCWGRRKASRVRDYEASSTALMPREKGFATSAVPLGSGISGASPVAAALPLPLEDKAITSDISKISNSIKNHVQSYYQMGRVSPGLIDLDDINGLGSSQPISAGTLSTLLDNHRTREIALRFSIAWVVCSRMLPSSDSGTSLLPVEVAGCFQKMANKHRGSPGKHDNEHGIDPN